MFRRRCRTCTASTSCAAFLASVLALFALPTGSSNWQTQLTNDIEEIRRNANLPSIGFALVIGNTPVLTAAVGRSNIAETISATADTPYLMASVSKTFVATALMQMIDTSSTTSGMSSLSITINDPVNGISLIVGRINDAGDKKVIRISHLVSHTSGIRDRWIWGNEPGKPDSLYFPGDSPITLDEMMRGYFLPGGKWYNARGNFQPKRPGKNYQYSNFNADLVGYLVETVTGIQLRDYSRMKLFEPLGMTNSGWRLADFANQSLIAMPYMRVGVAVMINQDGEESSRPNQGVFWKSHEGEGYYYDEPNIGHSGYDYGAATEMWLLLNSRVGVAVMINQDGEESSRPNQGVFWKSHEGEGYYYDEPNIGHSGYDYGAATEMWLLLNSRVGVAVMINQDGDAAEVAMPKVLRLLVAAGRQVALTMGACCHTDGTCATRTQEECRAENGRYQGNQADCGSTTCHVPQPAS
eukprot:CAMPEP_0178719822 /NCGR_PEP_ID=MMETSP0699-20121125/23369_1 /TAXON_ID=265572 /ORGANISM="Extubocellulus spinifer, Strain CCMP396" /LENGTH=467 /DNA_ID=CAMNT_0020370163 /DNA_START=147 /DNA_END=1551 /DNA_ORIENTATION=+